MWILESNFFLMNYIKTILDVFLFYSQTFSENQVSIDSVDKILDQFFEGGGWAQCFDSIYAIEANIPAELDNYIPPAQEELYNWVNGPNRQFEAGKIVTISFFILNLELWKAGLRPTLISMFSMLFHHQDFASSKAENGEITMVSI